MEEHDLTEIRKISIEEYLSNRGVNVEKRGPRAMCSSPLSSDSDPSFMIYPTNTFYDWSSGKGGDIIRLVELMEGLTFLEAVDHLKGGNYEVIEKATSEGIDQTPHYEFVLAKYQSKRKEDVRAITRYAERRKVTEGYEPGVFFTKEDGEWVSHPSMMYLHVDEEGEICGARFRKIYPRGKRFSSRGRLCYYILENPVEDKIERLFLVESESSANSLWMHARAIGLSCAIVSFGGVSNIQQQLPSRYDAVKDRRLFIDYDGDEEQYQNRLNLYSHLDVRPVRLPLPKGEDFNSLYCEGNIHLINPFIV